MANPLATVTDVGGIFHRPLTDSELSMATGLINQASIELRLRVPGVDEVIASDELRRAKAAAAIANAVKRVLLNPQALAQHSDTEGGFSESSTPGDAIKSGAIYFTAADLFGLAPASASNIPRTARIRSGYPGA